MMISIVVINNYYELGPVTLPDNMAQPEVKCVGQVWYAIVCSTLKIDMTRNQINDTFLFQNRVKVKVVGEVSEK